MPGQDTTDNPTFDGLGTTNAGESAGVLWVHGALAGRFTPLFEQLGVGRAPECGACIDSGQVSRRHATLVRTPQGFGVEDASSRNGTFVNGGRTSSAALSTGSVLRFGDAVGIFWHEPGPAPAPFEELGPGMFGGERLRRAFSDLPRIAPSALSVVVVGETGTGKEAAARELHRLSGRGGPLVSVNCATIPLELAEAQLFGHIKGAFTGATTNEAGYFKSADLGTLFLDEVTELPPSVQAKLLRVLQERELTPVGSTKSTRVDVRIVSATQRPLVEAVRAGRFRQDVAARLDGFQMTLPALRERREDISPLFLAFLARRLVGRGTPALHASTVERLCVHDWPNNVRELNNVAEQVALLRGDQPVLLLEHVPEALRSGFSSAASSSALATEPPPPDVVPADPTAARFRQALAAHHGNVRQAAEAVGISRTRAYRMIDKGQVDLQSVRATTDKD